MESLITVCSKEHLDLISQIREALIQIDTIEHKHYPSLFNESYLDGNQIQELFSISKRSLQEYRDSGAVPFTTFSGKILYKESDIKNILEKNYRPARKKQVW